jgi:hypothetical protein
MRECCHRGSAFPTLPKTLGFGSANVGFCALDSVITSAEREAVADDLDRYVCRWYIKHNQFFTCYADRIPRRLLWRQAL